MKINIKATGVELTPAISDYVHKKVSVIGKYLSENHADAVAQVEVGKNTNHHKAGMDIFHAEVHITGTGLDIYATSDMDDLYAAIDTVKDEVVQSVLQLKGKQATLARRSAELMKNMMKGLTGSTVRGFSWGVERLKFKGFKSFKKRQ